MNMFYGALKAITLAACGMGLLISCSSIFHTLVSKPHQNEHT